MQEIQKRWIKLHENTRFRPRYPSTTLVSLALKSFKKGGKVLDLGCGCGKHTKFLAENGFEVYATDYSNAGLKAAKEFLEENKLKAEFKEAFIDDIPYEDGFFDAVVCYGVLNYNELEVIEKTAYEIHRVLAGGGVAFVFSRSNKDYRYCEGQKLGKFEAVVDEKDESRSAYPENGMKMYFLDKNEARRIFKAFRVCEVNRVRSSFADDTYADDDLSIILRK